MIRLLCGIAIGAKTVDCWMVPTTTTSTRSSIPSSQRRSSSFQASSFFHHRLPLSSTTLFSEPNVTLCEATDVQASSAPAQSADDMYLLVEDLEEGSSYQEMTLPSRITEYYKGHAIFGHLLGEDRIESYKIYQRRRNGDTTTLQPTDNVLVALVKFGDSVDGHPGVVHGGIISLVFDDALGFGYEAIGVSKAVTANLSIDFRAPLPAGTHVRIACQLEHREGRKLFWTGQMTSLDGETLYAEVKSLYIIPRSHA
jgi:acyl-coenzyme A thioesterase PaaI-like protein